MWIIKSPLGYYTINNDWTLEPLAKLVKVWHSLHLCQAAKAFWNIKGEIIEL